MTLEFSRQNPPRALIPVNVNHLGAQNVLIPVEYRPTTNRIKRTLKPEILERTTYYEDFNKMRPTPLHPPYESAPQASNIIQGKAFMVNSFPVIF